MSDIRSPNGFGIFLIVAGLSVALVGVLVYFGALSWFGRLPGDIRYEGEHTRFYFPITTMVLLSLIFTLLLHLFRKFF